MRLPYAVQLIALGLSTLLGAGCAIRPQRPDSLPAATIPQADEIVSTVSLPIHVDLSGRMGEIESRVPKVIDGWRAYTTNPQGIDYKYYIERDPLDINFSGNVVNVSVNLRYKVGVRVRIGPLWMEGICGDGKEWPRLASLTAHVAVDPLSDWRISLRVVDSSVKMGNPCRVSIPDLDLGRLLQSQLLDRFRDTLDVLAGQLQLNFRPYAEQAWKALQLPIEIYDNTWLSIVPRQVSLSELNGSGLRIDSVLGMSAQPVVTYGERPRSNVTPLPSPTSALTGSGFHIVFDVRLEYPALTDSLRGVLRGKRFYRGDKYIEIRDASIYGNGNNQLVLQLDFDGSAKGRMYFVAQPQLDSLTQVLSLSNLEFDIDTKNVILKTADWLYHDSLKEFLHRNARFDARRLLDRAKKALEASLNRPISEGVVLSGTMDSLQGLFVFAAPDGLFLRVRTDGSALLTIR